MRPPDNAAPRGAAENRVLFLTPTEKDAVLGGRILWEAGIPSRVCRGMDEFRKEFGRGAGALMLTEESLAGHGLDALRGTLDGQPAWSDVPVALVTQGGADSAVAARAMGELGNIFLLERPIRINAFVSALRSALRARRRQYLLRDQLMDQKRAGEEIARLNMDLEGKVVARTKELSAVNRELESFCYTISHDLRAPLRSIDGFSQIILEDGFEGMTPGAQGYFKRIRAASQRMAQLIDDLLEFSRLARKELRREVVDLSALARSIAEDLARRHPERRVDIVIAPGAWTRGDTTLLRVVLENLLENAWKFTQRRPRARIEFGRRTEPGETVCFVKDDGAGFDMAHSGKLFGPFQRLHGVEEFPGTGIGLATVQRVLQRHGGHVWAEGRVDAGATFFFSLPYHPSRHALALRAEGLPPDSRIAVSINGPADPRAVDEAPGPLPAPSERLSPAGVF